MTRWQLLHRSPLSFVLCQTWMQLRRRRSEPSIPWQEPSIGRHNSVWLWMPVTVLIRSPIAVLRAWERRLRRMAVVVRHKPVGLNLRQRLWLRLAVAISVRRRLELWPVPVLRWRRARTAAAAEGIVGSGHSAEVGIAADELGVGVGGRRRGTGGVSAVRPRGSSALQKGGRVKGV